MGIFWKMVERKNSRMTYNFWLVGGLKACEALKKIQSSGGGGRTNYNKASHGRKHILERVRHARGFLLILSEAPSS